MGQGFKSEKKVIPCQTFIYDFFVCVNIYAQ